MNDNQINNLDIYKKEMELQKSKKKIKKYKIYLSLSSICTIANIVGFSINVENFNEYNRLNNIYDNEIKIMGSFSFSYNGTSKTYLKQEFINSWNMDYFYIGTKKLSRYEFANNFFEYYYVGYSEDVNSISVLENASPLEFSNYLSALRSLTGLKYNISQSDYISLLKNERDLKFVDAKQDYFIFYLTFFIVFLVATTILSVVMFLEHKKLKKLG